MFLLCGHTIGRTVNYCDNNTLFGKVASSVVWLPTFGGLANAGGRGRFPAKQAGSDNRLIACPLALALQGTMRSAHSPNPLASLESARAALTPLGRGRSCSPKQVTLEADLQDIKHFQHPRCVCSDNLAPGSAVFQGQRFIRTRGDAAFIQKGRAAVASARSNKAPR